MRASHVCTHLTLSGPLRMHFIFMLRSKRAFVCFFCLHMFLRVCMSRCCFHVQLESVHLCLLMRKLALTLRVCVCGPMIYLCCWRNMFLDQRVSVTRILSFSHMRIHARWHATMHLLYLDMYTYLHMHTLSFHLILHVLIIFFAKLLSCMQVGTYP